MRNETFKSLRDKQGLTQVAFSVKHDISVSVIQALETGAVDRTSSFGPRIRRKLSEAYGVEIADIEAACVKQEHQPA